MDLPTCPSCGQSVLDDDATDCPFCGAAMDGSSGGKKPAAGEKSKKAAPQKEEQKPADEEDPFAIKQAPSSGKAVQCARKPMKGRRLRVVCPMCDTQGFIPKAAIGRQVRCANKECLVPIFTAEDENSEAGTQPPSRISDEETPPVPPSGAGGMAKSPILMYSIAGGVLLLLTVGLVMYLNQDGVTELGPADIRMPVTDGEEDVEDPQPENVEPEIDRRQRALDLVAAMVDAARANDNMDKPRCRRLTADCYLRLGMDSEADEEFKQMNVLAARSGQNVEYYSVVPLVNAYWAQKAVGKDQAAIAALERARGMSDKIPESTGFAIETSVALAAAMADSGEIEQAVALVARQQRDDTIEAQRDGVRAGAWRSLAFVLREQNRRSMPVMEVFSWDSPMMTATAVELAIRKRWKAATDWAIAQPTQEVKADTLSAVAAEMVKGNAPADARSALLAAVQSQEQQLSLQVHAVLARDKDAADSWQQATAAFEKVPVESPAQMGSIIATLQSTKPELTSARRKAQAVADFIVAAIARGEDEKAAQGLQKLTSILLQDVPLSAEVRTLAGRIDSQSRAVKSEIAEAFALTDPGAITNRFVAYRRAVDHIVYAAEERRMFLLRMLGHIIQNGGLSVVENVTRDPESALTKEVAVDALTGLLYFAAAETGQDYSSILNTPESLAVPLARVSSSDEMLEYAVSSALVSVYSDVKENGFAAVTKLTPRAQLPGLQSVVVTRIAEGAALTTDAVPVLLEQILGLKHELWRNQCFRMATQVIADHGKVDDLNNAIKQLSLNSSQQVSALYAVTLKAIEAANEEPADDAGQVADSGK